MEIIITFVILILFVGGSYPMKKLPEDQILLFNEVPATKIAVRHPVKPLSEIKDANVVKQKYDFSCGSAALATLLDYYLHENMTEHQVIQGLMQYGDAKQIQEKRAFSLLDMKRFVNVLGYKGAGYTAELEDLKTLKTPAIVPIELYGYKHFVVFKGTYKDHVFLADPFMGNISFPVSQFLTMWYQNIVFIVTNGDKTINALALKERDLQVVYFDIEKPPLIADAYESVVKDQRDFQQSYGEYQYLILNAQ